MAKSEVILMSNNEQKFPSTFELWEFVLSFEDGSLPASAWNERALAVVAIWYLSLLAPAEAMARLEAGIRRNQLRLAPRGGAPGDGATSLGEVWPSALRHVLLAVGEADPVALANRLLEDRAA